MSTFDTSTSTESSLNVQQNPVFKDIALAPICSEYPEPVWPSILGTIDEIVRERKSFTKIKGLVKIWISGENMYNPRIRNHETNANSLIGFRILEV